MQASSRGGRAAVSARRTVADNVCRQLRAGGGLERQSRGDAGVVDRRADVAGVDRGDADVAAVLGPDAVGVRGEPALGDGVRGSERMVA